MSLIPAFTLLPPELIDHVLLFLPIETILRLRLLNKQWNTCLLQLSRIRRIGRSQAPVVYQLWNYETETQALQAWYDIVDAIKTYRNIEYAISQIQNRDTSNDSQAGENWLLQAMVLTIFIHQLLFIYNEEELINNAHKRAYEGSVLGGYNSVLEIYARLFSMLSDEMLALTVHVSAVVQRTHGYDLVFDLVLDIEALATRKRKVQIEQLTRDTDEQPSYELDEPWIFHFTRLCGDKEFLTDYLYHHDKWAIGLDVILYIILPEKFEEFVEQDVLRNHKRIYPRTARFVRWIVPLQIADRAGRGGVFHDIKPLNLDSGDEILPSYIRELYLHVLNKRDEVKKIRLDFRSLGQKMRSFTQTLDSKLWRR